MGLPLAPERAGGVTGELSPCVAFSSPTGALNFRFGREAYLRARGATAAMARTPVLPEATAVGALSAQLGRTQRGLQCPLHVETCQCANSDRSLTVRKKNGRRPRSMSARTRNHYYAMFDTRPRRAFQAAAGRLHRPLGGEPVSTSKRPVREHSDDPEGPAAVLGVSMSSRLCLGPHPRLRLALLDVWVQCGSSEITNLLCGGCRGAEVRDLWIPWSFRPQSA